MVKKEHHPVLRLLYGESGCLWCRIGAGEQGQPRLGVIVGGEERRQVFGQGRRGRLQLETERREAARVGEVPSCPAA